MDLEGVGEVQGGKGQGECKRNEEEGNGRLGHLFGVGGFFFFLLFLCFLLIGKKGSVWFGLVFVARRGREFAVFTVMRWGGRGLVAVGGCCWWVRFGFVRF